MSLPTTANQAITLPTPSSFPSFPYDPPYPIQVSLMQHVYEAIESVERRVAIVESPTGTVRNCNDLLAVYSTDFILGILG